MEQSNWDARLDPGSVDEDQFCGQCRDGSPRIDPITLALLQVSDVAGRFDDALAFATSSSRCVEIAAAIGKAVKKLWDAQDRALDKANQF